MQRRRSRPLPRNLPRWSIVAIFAFAGCAGGPDESLKPADKPVSTSPEADPDRRREGGLVLDSACLRLEGSSFAIWLGSAVPDTPTPTLATTFPSTSTGAVWEYRFHSLGDPARAFSLFTASKESGEGLARVARRRLTERLLELTRAPRRPYEEEWLAVASIVGDSGLARNDAETFRERLIGHLSNAQLSDEASRESRTARRRLAHALLAEVSDFSAEELAGLAASGDVVVRLLPLLRRALDGRRDAIEELLVLSLEFHGDAEYFRDALVLAIPRELNEELYRSTQSVDTPATPAERRDDARRFLRALRGKGGSLEAVETERGKRWRLRPEAS